MKLPTPQSRMKMKRLSWSPCSIIYFRSPTNICRLSKRTEYLQLGPSASGKSSPPLPRTLRTPSESSVNASSSQSQLLSRALFLRSERDIDLKSWLEGMRRSDIANGRINVSSNSSLKKHLLFKSKCSFAARLVCSCHTCFPSSLSPRPGALSPFLEGTQRKCLILFPRALQGMEPRIHSINFKRRC